MQRFFREIAAVIIKVSKSSQLTSYKMGKNSKPRHAIRPIRTDQVEASFFELQSRRERLQQVLERRQQTAVTEASTTTSTPTSTTVPETTTQATTEAVSDTKEPKKKKKKKKSKKLEDSNAN